MNKKVTIEKECREIAKKEKVTIRYLNYDKKIYVSSAQKEKRLFYSWVEVYEFLTQKSLMIQ